MSGAAQDSSIVELLKKSLTKYGTELLKPCDSVEELLRRLDKLEHHLSKTLQSHKELLEMSLQLCKDALIANGLIRHSELDVRVSVASCISRIIYITAPDEPYGEDHMKEFFQIAYSAFERLPCMSGRAYSKAVSILHSMSTSQSCVMMLDLEMYADVDDMFHLFLDGIRAKHTNEVLSSMEKIMTLIIHNNVDYDEFSLVLVKILLNSLRRENKNVSPVSFQLAENTFRNCSADLKTHLPEAVRSLDAPIEDYAEVVVSLFQDATQMGTTGSQNCGLHDLKLLEDMDTADDYQHLENDEDVEDIDLGQSISSTYPEGVCSCSKSSSCKSSRCECRAASGICSSSCSCSSTRCSNREASKGVLQPSGNMSEQKSEELHSGKKRNRRPNSLKQAEEGYDPFWMLVDWRTMKCHSKKHKKNIDYPAKNKTSKDLSPKPAGESIDNAISSEPSKTKKDSGRNDGVSADKTSASQCTPSKQKKKGSMAHQKQRTTSGSYGEEMIGCRIKVWWPLDQMFYKGTIMAFDPSHKHHQVDYDDGEIEILDLTTECWELLQDSKSSSREQGTDGAPSSS